MDAALALLGLLVLSPLMVLIALLIRVSSPGPVFYRQVRIARYGVPFEMIKFRTMIEDADKRGPHVTLERDPRITRVGAILRRSKLDELPELWNVLVGDMSLVGPRPEAARFVEQYPEHWRRILEVRPGITDLATLAFRDEEMVMRNVSDPEAVYMTVVLPVKTRLSLDYIQRRSLLLDLSILYHTVRAITVGRLTRQPPNPIAVRTQELVRQFDESR